MLELNYKKDSQGPWPLKASASKLELTFSGDFGRDRIQREKIGDVLETAVTAVLWLLSALGCVAITISAFDGFEQKNHLFWLAKSPFNLIFWVSCLTTAYLWSKIRQEGLNSQSLNLLQWDEQAAPAQKPSLDIYAFFSSQAKQAWNKSLKVADSRQRQNLRLVNPPAEQEVLAAVTASDLFLSLLADDSIKLVFLRLGINYRDIETIMKNYASLNPQNPEPELGQVPFVAFTEGLKLHNKTIDPLMLLCALAVSLPEEHIIQSIFFNIDLTLEKLETISSWIFDLGLLRDEISLFRKMSKFKPSREINRGLTSVPTYYLDSYSTDLTLAAKHGALPLAWGRAQDLHEFFTLLSEGGKNLVIKGLEGEGRTTLINELAYKMAMEQVPQILEDKRLVKLEIPAILGNPQKAESTFVHTLQEAAKAGNIILVIEDLHELNRVQTTTGLTMLELLINFLQDSPLMVVGTTTINDYTDFLQNTSAFQETFSSYELSKLTREGVLLACCIKASLLETRGNCFFRYQAIEKAVALTDLYTKDLSQPQKAIAVLVEAASRIKTSPSKIITEELVDEIVSLKTHIPTQALGQNESEKLLRLEEALGKYIIGQKQAVTSVAEGLRRARSGLSSAARPLASFLFLGPTGVGKTEIARALAKVYFGEEKFLLRLDMSEYRGPDGITKLLGAEGSRVDSPLVKHLKNYPFCLLLMDEFEKAEPQVLNLFLQVLEDGRLTSGKGETLDMTHCLIIATSNAGTLEIQNGLKAHQTLEQVKTTLFNRTLTQFYPPELLNRFDGIVLFSPLSPEEVQQITLLQLENLRAQLKDKGIKINFAKAVAEDIAKNAYDPSLGARPIRRYIQDHVEGFIAKLILSKQATRSTELTVDLQNGELILK